MKEWFGRKNEIDHGHRQHRQLLQMTSAKMWMAYNGSDPKILFHGRTVNMFLKLFCIIREKEKKTEKFCT